MIRRCDVSRCQNSHIQSVRNHICTSATDARQQLWMFVPPHYIVFIMKYLCFPSVYRLKHIHSLRALIHHTYLLTRSISLFIARLTKFGISIEFPYSIFLPPYFPFLISISFALSFISFTIQMQQHDSEERLAISTIEQ